MEYEIVRLTDRPELKTAAARWFHEKWGIADALLRYICAGPVADDVDTVGTILLRHGRFDKA